MDEAVWLSRTLGECAKRLRIEPSVCFALLRRRGFPASSFAVKWALPIQHGTVGAYGKRGCRCPLCRKANSRDHAAYSKARCARDVNFHLSLLLRNRLASVRRGGKSGSAVRDLGCTLQHLALHLELLWDDGMTWENLKNRPGGWVIDHIRPVASFDLADRVQFLAACHFTNLQPMWHEDNGRKSDTDPWPTMKSHGENSLDTPRVL